MEMKMFAGQTMARLKDKERQENNREMRLTESLSNKDRDHKTLTERKNIEMSKQFKVTLSQ